MKIKYPHWMNGRSKEKDKKEISIESLAPKILQKKEEVEKIKPYLDSLKNTIATKGITNIALTGTYGSGKSTIIKTFQHQNPQFKYLNLSLASFKDIKDEAPPENLERLLEISILQQIFYHVKPAEIPDSRFKRIVNITNTRIFIIAIGLILWVSSCMALFKFNYIEKLNPAIWDRHDPLNYTSLFSILIFFIGIGFFTKAIIRLFNNSKINKFNIKGELELGDNLDKSVFNEHLEEILYFFERTDYNVVVIEDLDRFENTDIFTKLREINLLLNNSKLINREINFIYAIKDEIFKDKSERVKFFEYIIPVIPFINPSNAGEQMTKLIQATNIHGVLSKDFTEDVVTFIDDIDMRLLINIFHEYQIYKNSLSDDLNQDELFAIIAYKNLYPRDFGELHKRSGNLYKFISEKNRYTEALLNEVQAQIKMSASRISQIEEENISSLDELRAIYIYAIQKRIPEAAKIILDNEIAFSELHSDEYFSKLSKSKNISYSYYQTSHYYSGRFDRITNASNLSFSEIEKGVSTLTYDQRENLIREKNDRKIAILRKEIAKLRIKKQEIETWSLKQIFEEVEIEQYLGDFSNSQLIRNLLINGYINENYNDYISLFHEINLTKADFTFERRVKSGTISPFDFKITNIQNLLKRLPAKYLSREVILNYDILDFFLENIDSFKHQLDSFIELVASEKQRPLEFIDAYIDKRIKFKGLFVKYLYKSWDGFWPFIHPKSNFEESKIDRYLNLILEHCDIDDIIRTGGTNGLKVYISEMPNFFPTIEDQPDMNKINRVLSGLNIHLRKIDSKVSKTKKTFDFVYANSLYKINIDNISCLIQVKDQSISEEQIKKANYTTILESEIQVLNDYIDANINEYVEEVMLRLPENNSENETSLVSLLNNGNLKDTLKLDIMNRQTNKITDLSSIQDFVVKVILIENDKIVSDWNNIFHYYELNENMIDNALISFLNNDLNSTLLSKQKIDTFNKTKEFIKKFSLAILSCNVLTFNSYTALAKATPFNWASLNFKDLDQDKVNWMVDTKFLITSISNFTKLKEHFPDQHVKLLENDQTELMLKFDEYKLDDEDIVNVLQSNNISLENKIAIISKLSDNIIIDNEDIAKLICDLLSTTNMHIVSPNVVASLFGHSNSDKNRIKILNSHFDTLSDNEVKNLLQSLGESYEEIFKKQYKPKFKKSDYHIELFDKLKSRNLIMRFEEYNKDNNLLRVIANY